MAQLYEEEHADKQQHQQSGEASCHPCAPSNSNASAKTTESGKKKAAAAPRHTTSFKPNFDVYEGAEAYYVQGDLPGLSDKKVLSIEFSDDRTLVAWVHWAGSEAMGLS
jgi:HSP20 family molecular chaperone IbpA